MISPGIWDRRIADTPVAVIDFETTGGWPGPDRVVEVCVARVEPGEEPRVVLDTLVHPERRVACTHVHGITDADVADAPRFAEVAGAVVESIAGCVLAAYNVYFDIGFLREEFRRVGLQQVPPHLCLMYLQPLLGLGPRCRLGEACFRHGIELRRAHAASDDTLAAAGLWLRYRDAMAGRLATFRDLAALRRYKFVESFAGELLPPELAESLSRAPLKPRAAAVAPEVGAWT